jgi:hypothetical protein
MFCGWRLMNSYSELQALGAGLLEIDVLIPACHFNGERVDTLSIAHELHLWLLRDLQKHNIHIASLEEAALAVKIDLTRSPSSKNPRGNFYIGKDGMPITKGEFFKLEAKCKSNVRTKEATYGFERTHHEQWPVTWPEA